MDIQEKNSSAGRGRHLRALTAAVAACAVLSSQTAAFAQPAPGTQLQGTITTSLNTANAFVGEDITVNHVQSESGSIQNATLRGTVTDVTKAGQGRAAQIGMHFNYLTLADGTTYQIDGVPARVKANTASNAGKEVGGAVGGMLVGNALTQTLFAVAGGGILGAVGGFLLAHNNHQNVTVPAGSTIAVRLVSPLRQAQSAG